MPRGVSTAIFLPSEECAMLATKCLTEAQARAKRRTVMQMMSAAGLSTDGVDDDEEDDDDEDDEDEDEDDEDDDAWY